MVPHLTRQPNVSAYQRRNSGVEDSSSGRRGCTDRLSQAQWLDQSDCKPAPYFVLHIVCLSGVSGGRPMVQESDFCETALTIQGRSVPGPKGKQQRRSMWLCIVTSHKMWRMDQESHERDQEERVREKRSEKSVAWADLACVWSVAWCPPEPHAWLQA